MRKKRIIILCILILILILLAIIITKTKHIQNPTKEIAKGLYNTSIGTTDYNIDNAVTTVPNTPVISAGMIPVKKEGENFIITSKENNDWYNYEEGKPAYMILNDGMYQSEVVADMEGKRLASDYANGNAYIDMSEGNKPTIYMWIPRFAYNKEGEVIYIKQCYNVAGSWSVLDIFEYKTENENEPSYSLSGVWVEYSPLASSGEVNTKLSNMQGENNKYGFIGNTVGINANTDPLYTEAINAFLTSKLGENVYIDKDNTNRTILKVINTNKTEPIKLKAYYDVELEKVKIEVTYSKEDIVKILDEDGNILSENELTAVTVPNLKRNGIYKYIAIDSSNNLKETEVAVETVFRYQIPNLETLELFRDLVNGGNNFEGKTVEVVADIDMNPEKHWIDASTGEVVFASDAENWEPIGNSSKPFKGVFNGGYYNITGMYINHQMHDIGFFGRTLEGAIIKNIIIKDCYVYNSKENDTEPHTASIVGINYGIIENCASINGIISGKQAVAANSDKMAYTGGVVGYNANIVRNCYNTSTINQEVNTTTTYCQARAGGICGVNTGKILNCYNTGNITGIGGYVYVGGCVAVTYHSSYSKVEYTEVVNCYSKGEINGTGKDKQISNVHNGEVLGSLGNTSDSGATISNCYCLNGVNYLYHYYNSGWGNSGSEGKTNESVLKTYADRVDGFSVLGDAFMKDEWGINNGYPILIWQVPDWQFTEKNTTIAIGEKIDIDVIDIGKNMLHKNQASFSWTSSNNGIATVDSNGKVTGVSEGEVTITATNGEITLTTKISVVDAKLANTNTTTYIYTAKDLVDFRDDVNSGNNYAGQTVQLMADIDLSTICGQKIDSWEPIGAQENSFEGVFDGKYYKINYLYSNNNKNRRLGLFSLVTSSALVKNVVMNKIYLYNNYNEDSGSNTTGGIAGTNEGKIENCGIEYGICRGKSLLVRNAVVTVGGITGETSKSGRIINCYNKAKVNAICSNDGSQCCAGGIQGSGTAQIENCYNLGNIIVSGYKGACGGIAGSNNKISTECIMNSYSIGKIECLNYTIIHNGGIVGRTGYSSSYPAVLIKNCYCTSKPSLYKYDTTTKKYIEENSEYVDEGTLKTYASVLGDAFVDDTTPNINNGYPILKWQLSEYR